jgi:DNA-binding transcriptional LysR family regulator
VARLERGLGARLLNRSTRRLSLTEAGEALYRHCRRMLDEARQAQQAVGRFQAAPRGLIRLAAPLAFGTLRLAPALPAFLMRYAELRIDLSLLTRAPDLVANAYDLAIVVTHEPDPGVAARRIAPAPHLICAAPAYLGAHGVPAHPQDLARHNCLHVARTWELGGVAVPVSGTLRADDERTLWQAAREGVGLALLPFYMVQEDLRSGRLIRVLGDYPPVARSVYAVRLPGIHVPSKLRALIDYLCRHFDCMDEAGLPAPALHAKPAVRRIPDAAACRVPADPSPPRTAP